MYLDGGAYPDLVVQSITTLFAALAGAGVGALAASRIEDRKQRKVETIRRTETVIRCADIITEAHSRFFDLHRHIYGVVTIRRISGSYEEMAEGYVPATSEGLVPLSIPEDIAYAISVKDREFGKFARSSIYQYSRMYSAIAETYSIIKDLSKERIVQNGGKLSPTDRPRLASYMKFLDESTPILCIDFQRFGTAIEGLLEELSASGDVETSFAYEPFPTLPPLLNKSSSPRS